MPQDRPLSPMELALMPGPYGNIGTQSPGPQDRQLSSDELEKMDQNSFAASHPVTSVSPAPPPQPPPSPPSFLDRLTNNAAYKWATTPPKWAQRMANERHALAETMDQPSLNRTPWEAQKAGFWAGSADARGQLAAGYTSPAAVASLVAPEAATIGRAAGLGRTATNLIRGVGAIGSTPYAAHGAQTMYEGAKEGNWGKTLQGGVEGATGLLGLFGGMKNMEGGPPSPPTPTPTPVEPPVPPPPTASEIANIAAAARRAAMIDKLQEAGFTPADATATVRKAEGSQIIREGLNPTEPPNPLRASNVAQQQGQALTDKDWGAVADRMTAAQKASDISKKVASTYADQATKEADAKAMIGTMREGMIPTGATTSDTYKTPIPGGTASATQKYGLPDLSDEDIASLNDVVPPTPVPGEPPPPPSSDADVGPFGRLLGTPPPGAPSILRGRIAGIPVTPPAPRRLPEGGAFNMGPSDLQIHGTGGGDIPTPPHDPLSMSLGGPEDIPPETPIPPVKRLIPTPQEPIESFQPGDTVHFHSDRNKGSGTVISTIQDPIWGDLVHTKMDDGSEQAPVFSLLRHDPPAYEMVSPQAAPYVPPDSPPTPPTSPVDDSFLQKMLRLQQEQEAAKGPRAPGKPRTMKGFNKGVDDILNTTGTETPPTVPTPPPPVGPPIAPEVPPVPVEPVTPPLISQPESANAVETPPAPPVTPPPPPPGKVYPGDEFPEFKAAREDAYGKMKGMNKADRETQWGKVKELMDFLSGKSEGKPFSPAEQAARAANPVTPPPVGPSNAGVGSMEPTEDLAAEVARWKAANPTPPVARPPAPPIETPPPSTQPPGKTKGWEMREAALAARTAKKATAAEALLKSQGETDAATQIQAEFDKVNQQKETREAPSRKALDELAKFLKGESGAATIPALSPLQKRLALTGAGGLAGGAIGASTDDEDPLMGGLRGAAAGASLGYLGGGAFMPQEGVPSLSAFLKTKPTSAEVSAFMRSGGTSAEVSPLQKMINRVSPPPNIPQTSSYAPSTPTSKIGRVLDEALDWRKSGFLNPLTHLAFAKKVGSDMGNYANNAAIAGMTDIRDTAKALMAGKRGADLPPFQSKKMLTEALRVPTNAANTLQGTLHPSIAPSSIGMDIPNRSRGLLGEVTRPYSGIQYAVSEAYRRAGWSPEAIQKALYLNEAESKMGQNFSNFAKSNRLTKLLWPFPNIQRSITEQGVQQLPGLAAMQSGKMRGNPNTLLQRQLLGAGYFGAGALAGAEDDSDMTPAKLGALAVAGSTAGNGALAGLLGYTATKGGRAAYNLIPGLSPPLNPPSKDELAPGYIKDLIGENVNDTVYGGFDFGKKNK